jgi:hypothetical protein
MFEINLECFLSKEITIKLWKDLFVLEQPTVKQLGQVISKTDQFTIDEIHNTSIMIDVLWSFIKDPWWFGYRRKKLKYILKHLTPDNLIKVRNEIFFWLGLTNHNYNDLLNHETIVPLVEDEEMLTDPLWHWLH